MGAPFQPNDQPAAISGLFSTWLSQPSQGTISLQHDLYPICANQAGPSLDILARSTYNLRTTAECLGVGSYNDRLLEVVGLVPGGNPLPPAPTTNAPRPPVATTTVARSQTGAIPPRTTIRDSQSSPTPTQIKVETTKSGSATPTDLIRDSGSGVTKAMTGLSLLMALFYCIL